MITEWGFPHAGRRIKFARGKTPSFSELFLRNLKSRKSQISLHWHPFYFVQVHFLGLWSGCIHPPNIWTALFEKETYKQKPPRLKCSKMPRIWRDNPLKWVLVIRDRILGSVCLFWGSFLFVWFFLCPPGKIFFQRSSGQILPSGPLMDTSPPVYARWGLF